MQTRFRRQKHCIFWKNDWTNSTTISLLKKMFCFVVLHCKFHIILLFRVNHFFCMIHQSMFIFIVFRLLFFQIVKLLRTLINVLLYKKSSMMIFEFSMIFMTKSLAWSSINFLNRRMSHRKSISSFDLIFIQSAFEFETINFRSTVIDNEFFSTNWIIEENWETCELKEFMTKKISILFSKDIWEIWTDKRWC